MFRRRIADTTFRFQLSEPPTCRRPHQTDGQEVPEVVEQRVLDLEALAGSHAARAGSGHHQLRPVQAHAGQGVVGADVSG